MLVEVKDFATFILLLTYLRRHKAVFSAHTDVLEYYYCMFGIGIVVDYVTGISLLIALTGSKVRCRLMFAM